MTSMLTTAIALISIVLPSGLIASVDDQDFNLRAQAHDDVADLFGTKTVEPVIAPASRGRPRAPTPERRFVPACPSNIFSGRIVDTAMCLSAVQQCEGAGQADAAMYYLLTAPAGTTLAEPGWNIAGQACRGANAPDAPVIPQMTLDDFRRLPIAPGRVHVEPIGLRALINVPTNFYVVANVQILPTTITGVPVRARATPTEYVWSYGDGTSLTTADAGAQYPDMRTPHTYPRPGSMVASLETRYKGEYSVDGGPWLPIPGQAAVASPPVTLTLLQARSELTSGVASKPIAVIRKQPGP